MTTERRAEETAPPPMSDPTPAPAPIPAAAPAAALDAGAPPMETRRLDAFFTRHHAVQGIDLVFPSNSVTAIIGPSGCGKSTYLRCLNRMHELVPGARAGGLALLRGLDIYAGGADPVAIRRAVGMVFQRPNPFPTKSDRGQRPRRAAVQPDEAAPRTSATTWSSAPCGAPACGTR